MYSQMIGVNNKGIMSPVKQREVEIKKNTFVWAVHIVVSLPIQLERDFCYIYVTVDHHWLCIFLSYNVTFLIFW
jgi:hypothetical protein